MLTPSVPRTFFWRAHGRATHSGRARARDARPAAVAHGGLPVTAVNSSRPSSPCRDWIHYKCPRRTRRESDCPVGTTHKVEKGMVAGSAKARRPRRSSREPPGRHALATKVRSAKCAYRNARSTRPCRRVCMLWPPRGDRQARAPPAAHVRRASAPLCTRHPPRCPHWSSEPHRGGSGRALSRASPARPPGWFGSRCEKSNRAAQRSHL